MPSGSRCRPAGSTTPASSRSGRAGCSGSSAAVDAYHDWNADRIVVESNNGGEMCEMVIQGVDPTVSVKTITASRGKRTRAEPVSSLYEADEAREKEAKVRHVGVFPELEEEQTTWTPEDPSPNRMDAVVWGLTELKISKPPAAVRGSHVAEGMMEDYAVADDVGGYL
jgi:phage terminase large subunit-like protein